MDQICDLVAVSFVKSWWGFNNRKSPCLVFSVLLCSVRIQPEASGTLGKLSILKSHLQPLMQSCIALDIQSKPLLLISKQNIALVEAVFL